MYISIWRNNVLVVKVKPLSNSELSQKKGQEDIVRLNFITESSIFIEIGDYIILKKTQEKYYLNKRPRVTDSPKEYQYECVFEGAIHTLKKYKVFLETPKPDGVTYYKDYSFSLTGNAYSFLNFIVNNLNRYGDNYEIGSYEETETSNIEFNNWTVFEAIQEITSTLDIGWYLDGNILHFTEKEINTTYLFQVGRMAGFKKLIRSRVENEDVKTVVYGYGSTSNLPLRVNPSGINYDSILLSENRLCFSGEDGESKLTNNVDTYGVIEEVKEFDNIHPEFTGMVDDINTNVLYFSDASVNFDLNNYLLPSEPAKITFLTGLLVGLTFEISSFNNNTKTFELVPYSDTSGEYPNSLINIQIGDSYKLFNIYLPQTYIDAAETRLQEATQNYLNQQSTPLEHYTGELDEQFIQKNNIDLRLGQVVRIISGTFSLDKLFPIIELKQNLINLSKYQIAFGDALPKGLLYSLKINNFNTQNNLSSINKTVINNTTNITEVGGDVEWEQL